MKISVLKVLGGVAVGVGAVAAAPFTGGGSILGAATLASSLAGAGAVAAGAGAVGAAAGVALSNSDSEEDKIRVAKEEGRQEAIAENALEMEKFRAELEEMLADTSKREQFIVTAFAVGICAANADGEICEDEREELDVLVTGIGTSDKLSQTTKQQIKEFIDNPPNLNTVWALIEEHNFDDEAHLQKFSFIISAIAAADGTTCQNEKEFIEAWNSLAA